MMDVCAKRCDRGGCPFVGVSLLLVAKLGCSVSIAATWEVSWGSAEPPLSQQVATYTRYLLGCRRALLLCAHAQLLEHLWLETGWRNHCHIAKGGRNVAPLSHRESPACRDPGISTWEPKPHLLGHG